MTLYIILGMLVWMLGSLAATWLFTYYTGSLYKDGIDEVSGYIFFILCWPLIIIGGLFIFVINGVDKYFRPFYKILGRLNPLRIWDKVALHGAKRGKQ